MKNRVLPFLLREVVAIIIHKYRGKKKDSNGFFFFSISLNPGDNWIFVSLRRKQNKITINFTYVLQPIDCIPRRNISGWTKQKNVFFASVS